LLLFFPSRNQITTFTFNIRKKKTFTFSLAISVEISFLPSFPWGDLMPLFGRMVEWHGTGLI
jgi:hypothetical protein